LSGVGQNIKSKVGGALLSGHFYSSESEDELDLELFTLEYSKVRGSMINKNM